MGLLHTDHKQVSASINILSCVQFFALTTTDNEIPINLSDREDAAVMIPYEDECESRYGRRERKVEK